MFIPIVATLAGTFCHATLVDFDEQVILKKKYSANRDHLPACYLKGGEGEWGERGVASEWTKGYCQSVLEFGGGSGSVSAVIQEKISDKKNHVVVQPRGRGAMFGGYKQLVANKNACQFEYTAIDHVLTAGEEDAILDLVNEPFDCIVADCEGCLPGEFNKNPKLFEHVRYIQVERDDRRPLNAKHGPYDDLFHKMHFLKVATSYGCGGKCYTEVWMRTPGKQG